LKLHDLLAVGAQQVLVKDARLEEVEKRCPAPHSPRDSSLKAEDRAVAGLRSEVLKNAVTERNAGLRRARELDEKENRREQARKRQKLDVPPAAGAGSSR